MMWLFSLTIFSYSNFGLLAPSFLFLSDERISQHLCVRCDKKPWRKKPSDDRGRGGRALPLFAIIKGDYSQTLRISWSWSSSHSLSSLYGRDKSCVHILGILAASRCRQGLMLVWLVSVKWLGWGSAHAIVRSHYKTVKCPVLFGRKLLVQAKCGAGG